MSESEFYIGYKPSAPPRQARFLRRVIGSLIATGVALALALTALQKSFDPGEFEFGVIRDFSGLLLERPVPTLLVVNPAQAGNPLSSYSRFLLVAPAKFGAADLVAGLHGRGIAVQGSLIHRGGDLVIALVPDSIRETVSQIDPGASPAIEVGKHTVAGEIVDSKCYLGVMKPGREQTCRACAVHCISGGIPPILRATGVDAEPIHLLLVGSDGAPINKEVLDLVAEPVEVSGTIRRLGDRLLLLADPSSICRLGS